jgi:hypothetical protein
VDSEVAPDGLACKVEAKVGRSLAEMEEVKVDWVPSAGA